MIDVERLKLCPPPTDWASSRKRGGGPSYSNSALIGFKDILLSHFRPRIGCESHLLIGPAQCKTDGEEELAGKMAATAASVGRLEEEALRRKERLKALREKTGRKVRSGG